MMLRALNPTTVPNRTAHRTSSVSLGLIGLLLEEVRFANASVGIKDPAELFTFEPFQAHDVLGHECVTSLRRWLGGVWSACVARLVFSKRDRCDGPEWREAGCATKRA